jgi:hypothetical protein
MESRTDKKLNFNYCFSFCAELNLAWWSACFAGGFADFVVQRGGKWWTSCGALRGKRGRETTTFQGLKSTPRF